MIPIEEIRRAREVIFVDSIRTPLVRLNLPDSPAEIYLKLETLQPIGSFKIRGASYAVRQASPEEVSRGVITASAGNMAQGVASVARTLGVSCTVIVPENAPETKLAAIERLDGKYIKVPFDRWWQTLQETSYPGVEGLFVHPVEDERVMAGNGTIGLEILEDLPDPDVVLIPWGGRRSEHRHRERDAFFGTDGQGLRRGTGNGLTAQSIVRQGLDSNRRLYAFLRRWRRRENAASQDVAPGPRAS